MNFTSPVTNLHVFRHERYQCAIYTHTHTHSHDAIRMNAPVKAVIESGSVVKMLMITHNNCYYYGNM